MSPIFVLNCLVFDGAIDFTVEISGDQDVSALKKMIKEKLPITFGHVDANELSLWSVALDLDDELIPKVKAKVTTEKPLLGVEKLSSAFEGDLQEEQLHVVVRYPVPLQLNCLVLGDDPNCIFTIDISGTETVYALKESIKLKKKHTFRNLDAPRLDLWKVSIPSANISAKLAELRFVKGEALFPLHKLSKIFSDEPDNGSLHIVVQRPAQDEKQSNNEEASDRSPNLCENFERVIKMATEGPTPSVDRLPELCENFKRVMKMENEGPTPSVGAGSYEYAVHQAGDNPIFDGRYDYLDCRGRAYRVFTDTVAVPIEIFHPVFAHFIDDVNNPNLDVPKDLLVQTVEYFRKASAVYADENDRRDTLAPLLSEAIGLTIQVVDNGRNNPGGQALCPADFFAKPVLVIVREVENEILTGGSCPCARSNLSYVQHWAQSELEDICSASCCPAILIAEAGPLTMVFGAVITDKVIVQPLADFIQTVDVPLVEEPYRSFARVLYSLRVACQRLKQYWQTFTPPPVDQFNDEHPRFYPHVTSFKTSGAATVTRFRYLRYLEKHHGCAAFLAELIEWPERKVVVKFVLRYGEAAHQVAAAAGIAPTLLYCGSIDSNPDAPSYAGLRMVVMDYVKGTISLSLAARKSLPTDFIQQVTDAVAILHNHNPPFVFGDLRLQNIMITTDKKIQLIDFDWAGVHHEDTYPLRMSTIPGMWAEGMGRLEMMDVKHDLGMIQKLEEQI